MPNYQDAKIYKLESAGGLYIGSTTRTLSQRLSIHKNHHKMRCEGKPLNTSSHLVMCHPDYKISLLELFPCDTIQELVERERFYIVSFPECVNIRMRHTKEEMYDKEKQKQIEKYHQAREATREQREAIKEAKKEATKERQKLKEKERYAQNREALIQKSKQRYEANKEQILAKLREWQGAHKEQLVEYNKEYYEQNKAKLNERTKTYYAQNKEIINARVNCPICNKSMVKNSLRNHMPRFHPVPSDVAIE